MTTTNQNNKRALQISVRGVVQGVGFRPFIYRLALENGLTGSVRNTSGSVEIAVEGGERALDHFVNTLRCSPPPMAKIHHIHIKDTAITGRSSFEIEPSQAQETDYQLVSPDIATCPDCRKEIFNPTDRRYRYPFTNCTNCGPRFTIIEDIPYDRPRTTMSVFEMCQDCRKEYENPLDRRFHAEPNACPVCGPKLEIRDIRGMLIDAADPLAKAAGLLKEGKIIAIKGLGGFQLCCDASNRVSVQELRRRKKRPTKPLAVMLANLDEIKNHCTLTTAEEKLLLSPEAPIVLARWQQAQSNIARNVAPGNLYLGVMLPYTPLHHLLMKETGIPLVMTSGNLSEEPICSDNTEAIQRLNRIADYFLMHNRDIFSRYDDSVYIVNKEIPQAVRRARGFAPYPVHLPFKAGQILACGAQEKNTFCLTRDENAFISQHIGDLENEETLNHFETTIELYKKLFRIEPETIACDMHPDYLSTQYGQWLSGNNKLPLIEVQHHHAHIAACLAENNYSGKSIGVAFDGTGYGPDGTIWGGEFLIADMKEFRRAAYLDPVTMPGGHLAIERPYRMSLAYLYSYFGQEISLKDLPILQRLEKEEIEAVQEQIAEHINTPMTSSAGRLFDAVSALLGIRGLIDYDAQAAVELEMTADPDFEGEPYPFSIEKSGDAYIINFKALFSALVEQKRSSVPLGEISGRFHCTIAAMILKTCKILKEDSGLNTVALSGGVFQNRLLYRLTTEALKKSGFNVLTHRLVPCNDGGISFGQAVIAHYRKEV